MKKRMNWLWLLLVFFVFAGCDTVNEEQSSVEIVVEESEIESDEMVMEETSQVAESVIEEPAEEVKTELKNITIYGVDTEIEYGKESEYVSVVRRAGYANDRYHGIYIEKRDDCWVWCYTGDDTSDNMWDYGLLDEECVLTEKEMNESFDAQDDLTLEYMEDCETGIAEPLDLDGDGMICWAEAYIVAMLYGSEKYTFNGCLILGKDVGYFEDSGISLALSADERNQANKYKWCIDEYEGEYSMIINVVASGKPGEENAKIELKVTDSIFDYKIFEVIKCNNELLWNSQNKSEWTDPVYGGNGIYGFVGDRILLSKNELRLDEDSASNIQLITRNGQEYIIKWHADGSMSVNRGNLIK